MSGSLIVLSSRIGSRRESGHAKNLVTRFNWTATDLVSFSSSRRIRNISESVEASWVQMSRVVWWDYTLLLRPTGRDPVLVN